MSEHSFISDMMPEAEFRERQRSKLKLWDEMRAALRIVEAGIWRHPKDNTCGLAGAAVAVHAVEAVLAKCNAIDQPK